VTVSELMNTSKLKKEGEEKRKIEREIENQQAIDSHTCLAAAATPAQRGPCCYS
jgi:hypothetical protein